MSAATTPVNSLDTSHQVKPARSSGCIAILSLVIVVVVVALYWPVHTHPFLPTDDNFYIVDNVHMHNGVHWETVKWAFTAMDMVNWIPLTWLAHAADYRLFGASPAGHHLVNVFLHALAAVLLFWTFYRATHLSGAP